jgi:hypothetical protein
MDGPVRIGDDGGGGIDVDRQSLISAITALNNFIHERKEF